ncbi:YrdB family protein [Paenibacillus sp. LHD-117]|uniref:YrdB family protein n=1 Tax=Paenibacillus sp. LHD-117 TaxID=3071412 RepID=UPI0027DF11AC|nr:YrdB family protein [Paenibacillus sp. LHD-117]MDQ6417984.1 YrdB family protein [Paenibacillus sp. LHD-117]
MMVFQAIILVVLFLVEIAALAALGYWGFHVERGLVLRILLGIGTPLLTAVFWGMFIAPKAAFPVTIPVRALLQLIVFGLSAAALYASGRTGLAVTFAVVALVDMAFVYSLKLYEWQHS